MSEQEHLPYRDGRDDEPERRRFLRDVIIGFAIGAALVGISGCNLALSNIYYTSKVPAASFQTNEFNWFGPAVLFVVVMGTALGIMAFARRRGRRGYLVGALIGVGVCLLIEGICFYTQLP